MNPVIERLVSLLSGLLEQGLPPGDVVPAFHRVSGIPPERLPGVEAALAAPWDEWEDTLLTGLVAAAVQGKDAKALVQLRRAKKDAFAEWPGLDADWRRLHDRTGRELSQRFRQWQAEWSSFQLRIFVSSPQAALLSQGLSADQIREVFLNWEGERRELTKEADAVLREAIAAALAKPDLDAFRRAEILTDLSGLSHGTPQDKKDALLAMNLACDNKLYERLTAVPGVDGDLIVKVLDRGRDALERLAMELERSWQSSAHRQIGRSEAIEDSVGDFHLKLLAEYCGDIMKPVPDEPNPVPNWKRYSVNRLANFELGHIAEKMLKRQKKEIGLEALEGVEIAPTKTMVWQSTQEKFCPDQVWREMESVKDKIQSQWVLYYRTAEELQRAVPNLKQTIEDLQNILSRLDNAYSVRAWNGLDVSVPLKQLTPPLPSAEQVRAEKAWGEVKEGLQEIGTAGRLSDWARAPRQLHEFILRANEPDWNHNADPLAAFSALLKDGKLKHDDVSELVRSVRAHRGKALSLLGEMCSVYRRQLAHYAAEALQMPSATIALVAMKAEKFSSQDTGKVLGISQGAVDTSWNRIRNRIRG